MIEAVKAIVDLVEQARERGDRERMENLRRARMNMEVPYQSEMDWNGDEDDGNTTWESPTQS